jgi:XTP/dITP diphosphohydrolase
VTEQAGGSDVPPSGRLLLVLTSSRVAPGLLTWSSWRQLQAADLVFAADLDEAWQDALAEAGIAVADLAADPVALRAGRLAEAADGGRLVVWFGSPDGDPGLTDALAEHLVRRAVAAEPPEVELLGGSHDLPGARLLDLVAVMDRLRSPGGCPWDAEQTHASLAPYLLEESHEVLEAIETGDRDHLVEELGDLLLQVVFHARMAQDDEVAPFDIDEVAAGIVDKLVRRHPHVFADVTVAGAHEVSANWEQIKADEKQRSGPFEGIPQTLPALARAQKMLDRLKAPTDVAVPGGPADPDASDASNERDEPDEPDEPDDELVAALLSAVQMARRQGRDAETELRAALSRWAGDIETMNEAR